MAIRDRLTVEYFIAEIGHCRCAVERQSMETAKLMILCHRWN